MLSKLASHGDKKTLKFGRRAKDTHIHWSRKLREQTWSRKIVKQEVAKKN